MTKSVVCLLHESVSQTGCVANMSLMSVITWTLCLVYHMSPFATAGCVRCCNHNECQVSTTTVDCIASMMGDQCPAMSPACTSVFQTDEQCSGQASEHKGILGAVLADCWHVHNRQQLFDVVQQQLVE